MELDSEKFVEKYQVMVRAIAKTIYEQLELSCEMEDLVGFGFRGLLEAKQRFDPSRGVQFKFFAYYRVRGAILDGVRSMAYLPRRAHARMQAARALDLECEAVAEIRGQNPQARTDIEENVRAIDAILGRVAVAFAVSTASYDEENKEYSSELDPESLAITAEESETIGRAIKQLPERERLVIQGFYRENRSLEEIGKQAGMSKSWASRAHAKALDRLRQSLETRKRRGE
ncbi:MAG: sigma-70 family RNA polymerase sigma factor [Deltaproteobacteria bacterium]|nr:sigma-70 family RNA polymerase sigma factor [Deltaproteobacteria bacterium]